MSNRNYSEPENYICIPLPDFKTLQRLRIEGCPYLNCKSYTVAFSLDENNNPKNVICGWEGRSYDCPIVPYWDKNTKWSLIQTDFLTIGE